MTLARMIAFTAFEEGFDVKQSELHGLSQRGGSLVCHVIFDEKVNSPLIPEGGADLIIALELNESIRCARYANEKTKFLVNEKTIKNGELEEAERGNWDVKTLRASEISKEITGTEAMANTYMFAKAVRLGLLPFKKENVVKIVREMIRKEFLEDNLKILEKGFE